MGPTEPSSTCFCLTLPSAWRQGDDLSHFMMSSALTRLPSDVGWPLISFSLTQPVPPPLLFLWSLLLSVCVFYLFSLSPSACVRSQLVTEPSLGFVSVGNRRSGKERRLQWGGQDAAESRGKKNVGWRKRERTAQRGIRLILVSWPSIHLLSPSFSLHGLLSASMSHWTLICTRKGWSQLFSSGVMLCLIQLNNYQQIRCMTSFINRKFT